MSSRGIQWARIPGSLARSIIAGLVCAALVARQAAAFPLVTQPGDTLAGIAQRVYGRADYEGLLVSANVLDVRGGVAIVPGLPLEVPALAYRRIAPGDTWTALAATLLGAPQRAAVLAFANDSKPWLSPTENAEILVPYNLRYIAEGGETIVDVAERFLHSKKRAWMLSEYNGIKDVVLHAGQLVLVPLTDLRLTEEGRQAARQAFEGWGAGGDEQLNRQREAAEALPSLLADVRAGRYTEAVVRGVTLLAHAELTTPQRASVQRQLLEAYVALGATGRAVQACREWRAAAPRAPLDAAELSPKLLAACRLVRRSPD